MRTIWRIILYGIKNFRRNVWLSIIAIITMTMTLLTISVFAVGNLVAQKKYQDYNQNIDYLIFLKDSAGDADVNNLMEQVLAQPQVASAELVSKEQARVRFEQNFEDVAELKGIVTDQNNPLPREITVKFSNPTAINGFNQFASAERFQAIVQQVSYRQNAQLIDNYLRVTNFLRIIGLAFGAFFIVIAVLVILNTIRLTIYSRRDEIEVMRLVGASPGFIQGPFWVEGILYGVMSALIAALVVWGILEQVQRLVSQSFVDQTANFYTENFGSVLGGGSASLFSLVNYLFVIQLGVGIALGVVCSLMAVRRYLKEN